MEIPQKVLALVRKADAKHPGDIALAVQMAKDTISRLPDFKEVALLLIDQAVQDLVYEARHRRGGQIKNGFHRDCTPKVIVGSSPHVQAVYRDLLMMPIAGRMLGMLRGEDLEAAAADERERAMGHSANAALCEALAPLVPDGQTVQQAVPEKQLRRVWENIQAERERGAAWRGSP